MTLKPTFQVEICRTAGQFPQERFADTMSESSSDSAQSREDEDIQNSSVTVRVSVCNVMTLVPWQCGAESLTVISHMNFVFSRH